MKLGDQDKSWAPHKVCKHCTEMLCFWTQGKVSSMWFGVSMVWCEPKNYHADYYFCMVDMSGWNQQKKKDWYYQLDDPYHILFKFQFQFSLSLPDLTANKMLLEVMDDTNSSNSSNSSPSSMAAAASLLNKKAKPFSQG